MIKPNSTGRRQIHGKVSKEVSLANISEEERTQVLQTHFKFMILRDPVERMLSAYKDKVGVSFPGPYFRCSLCIFCFSKQMG